MSASSVVHEETAAHRTCESDSRHARHDTQQPAVLSTLDDSQQTMASTGRGCRQYQRRRTVQSATGDSGSSVGRLGLSSNLM